MLWVCARVLFVAGRCLCASARPRLKRHTVRAGGVIILLTAVSPAVALGLADAYTPWHLLCLPLRLAWNLAFVVRVVLRL